MHLTRMYLAAYNSQWLYTVTVFCIDAVSRVSSPSCCLANTKHPDLVCLSKRISSPSQIYHLLPYDKECKWYLQATWSAEGWVRISWLSLESLCPYTCCGCSLSRGYWGGRLQSMMHRCCIGCSAANLARLAKLGELAVQISCSNGTAQGLESTGVQCVSLLPYCRIWRIWIIYHDQQCFQDSTYNPIAALVHISPLGTLAHAVHFMRFLAISQDICMGLRLLWLSYKHASFEQGAGIS